MPVWPAKTSTTRPARQGMTMEHGPPRAAHFSFLAMTKCPNCCTNFSELQFDSVPFTSYHQRRNLGTANVHKNQPLHKDGQCRAVDCRPIIQNLFDDQNVDQLAPSQLAPEITAGSKSSSTTSGNRQNLLSRPGSSINNRCSLSYDTCPSRCLRTTTNPALPAAKRNARGPGPILASCNLELRLKAR
jgi:hypothetical protein